MPGDLPPRFISQATKQQFPRLSIRLHDAYSRHVSAVCVTGDPSSPVMQAHVRAATVKNRKVRRVKADPVLYKLHYLVDRTGSGRQTGYLVLWQSIFGQSARIWEPRSSLLKDDPSLQDEMDLVDRWVDAGRLGTVEQFMAQDAAGVTLLTANDDESCGFVAILTAAELLGKPALYCGAVYDHFVRDSVHHSTDASVGLTPAAMVAFVAKLYIACAAIGTASLLTVLTQRIDEAHTQLSGSMDSTTHELGKFKTWRSLPALPKTASKLGLVKNP